ncbi:MAG: hypothetical protein ACI857_003452 [Arenicella sp.]|jgi:hypothetical protein
MCNYQFSIKTFLCRIFAVLALHGCSRSNSDLDESSQNCLDEWRVQWRINKEGERILGTVRRTCKATNLSCDYNFDFKCDVIDMYHEWKEDTLINESIVNNGEIILTSINEYDSNGKLI